MIFATIYIKSFDLETGLDDIYTGYNFGLFILDNLDLPFKFEPLMDLPGDSNFLFDTFTRSESNITVFFRTFCKAITD